jgi:hypothetical protein
MIETFLYITHDFEELSAYAMSYDISNQSLKGYRENYQKINQLCIQKKLLIPYVFYNKKIIFLAEDDGTASIFNSTINSENAVDIEHVVLPVAEDDYLVRRLIRNWLLINTSEHRPYNKKNGIEYLIDTKTNYNGDIIVSRFLNATFSNFPDSNILQLIFDLKSRSIDSWDQLPNQLKLFCSPNPKVRYELIKGKLVEIFGEVETISLQPPGNGIINFEHIQGDMRPSH